MNPEDKETELNQMKKHVQDFGKPDDRKAWIGIGNSIIFVALSIFLINMNHRLLGYGLLSLANVRLFILFHDMAHFSYFSSLTMNTFFGKIIGIHTHYPFNPWRDGHNHHHKYFGNLDRLDLSQTILFTKKQYENMKGLKKIAARILREPIVFFSVSLPFIWHVGLFYIIAKRYGIFSMSFAEKVFGVVLYVFIMPLFGIPTLQVWLSLYFAQVFGTILFHLQHSVNIPYRQRMEKWDFTKAAIEGSTFLYVPSLLKPFTYGIQYHHIHHLNTNVPSYMLRNCHEAYENKQGSNWDKFHINRVGIDLATVSFFNVMLDEETRRLIPFFYGL